MDGVKGNSSVVDDILAHYGVLGMKWGHRNASSESSNGSSSGESSKTGMSTKKKVAIGVGVVVGAAAVGYLLGRHGKIPISQINGGRDNIIRMKNGKAAISTLSEKQWNEKVSKTRRYARNFDLYNRMAREQGLSWVQKNPASGLSKEEHREMIKGLMRVNEIGLKKYGTPAFKSLSREEELRESAKSVRKAFRSSVKPELLR